MSTDPLRYHRNPVRLWCSASLWRAVGYAVTYPFVATLLFVGVVIALVPGIAVAVTWLGVPLLVAAGYLVRGAAVVERWRGRLVGGIPRPQHRDVPAGTGITGRLRLVWTDGTTWRAVAYLGLLYPLLMVLDVAALVVFAGCCAAIALPLWFWSIPDPGVVIGYTSGDDTVGLAVDDLPTALLVAVLALIAATAAAYLLVCLARAGRRLAVSLLGPAPDPLAAARRVLDSAGPLLTGRTT